MGRDHPRGPATGRRRPTSADVAAAAGVSRATVSYVLNGADQKHRISPATRDHVLEVAQRLGYEPNAVALALRAGRTEIVLVEMPNWPLGPPVAEAIDTMVESLEQLGYTPLVHFQRADPRSLTRASQRVHPVGVIAPGSQLSAEATERLRAFGARGLVAFAGRPLPHVYTYVIDQTRIGHLAVEHLAGRGHGRVLALMPEEPTLRAVAQERLSGARAAAGEHDMALRSVEVSVRRDAVGRALADVLARSNPPTAIFAFNDELALVTLELLRERGVSLPEQMAIIGCDDSAAAERIRPRLTTVRFDKHGRWREIAGHLDTMISGEGRAPEVTVSEPAVVLGDTT
ncbi:MAG: LacI family DNA-binding transcriptional regulator [Solirubrobacterales bacterium]|nr:LacI family DNA-binding transcriptional regulator [Solirubrobacterales bacterium]